LCSQIKRPAVALARPPANVRQQLLPLQLICTQTEPVQYSQDEPPCSVTQPNQVFLRQLLVVPQE